MKQTTSVLSTYAADVSGVCSALYELGGLTVMHDASGCNSTYNTHDEPRWYDMDSMVYISGLSEMEAIMGDDNKLITDIIAAAKELSPRFIAIAGTPIPMMIGTDFAAIASVIEHRTGIPSFGFPTNGMHSYLSGVSMALESFAKRFCRRDIKKNEGMHPSVNILGATPLDFSVTGSIDAMRGLFKDRGYDVVSCWTMGSTFDEVVEAGSANVNIVVSYSGLAVAREMRKMFDTPYVVGVPIGEKLKERLFACIDIAAQTGKNQTAYLTQIEKSEKPVYIVGESVFSASLRYALIHELGLADVRVNCPLETEPSLLLQGDTNALEEDDIHELLEKARAIIADPIYRRICPESVSFTDLPHEAYSGRIYRKKIPVLIDKAFVEWAHSKEYVL